MLGDDHNELEAWTAWEIIRTILMFPVFMTVAVLVGLGFTIVGGLIGVALFWLLGWLR